MAFYCILEVAAVFIALGPFLNSSVPPLVFIDFEALCCLLFVFCSSIPFAEVAFFNHSTS